MVLKPVKTPYWCRRVNPSTFLIIHDDKYGDTPFIYVKLSTGHRKRPIILLDTGSGPDAAKSKDLYHKDLKDFLCNYPIAENDWRPLMAAASPSSKAHDIENLQNHVIVVNTHCHYDHIGGNASFDQDPNVQICASGLHRAFLDDDSSKYPGRQTPRSKNSLCSGVGMKFPKYTIDRFLGRCEPLWHQYAPSEEGPPWAADESSVVAIPSPGHTPDSLSLYDREEGVLYVGDLFYARKCILPNGSPFRQAIEFPAAGDWNDYMDSLYHLRSWVICNQDQVQRQSGHELLISCSHTTAQVPALALLDPVIAMFRDIIKGTIHHKKSFQKDGETYNLWESGGDDPDLSVVAPARLLREVTDQTHSMMSRFMVK